MAQPSLWEECKLLNLSKPVSLPENVESTLYLHIHGTQQVLNKCQFCWMERLRTVWQVLIKSPPAVEQKRAAL